MHCSQLIHKAVIVSVILNIVLPKVLKPYATEEEIKPPNGAVSLSMKGQFMHMMVHHNQVPIMSSMIVALIVFLSNYIAYSFK